MRTASRVSGQPMMNPFLKNGPTACTSTIISLVSGPAMILAIVDDLMFTSKIKTAAAQTGVAVLFARSSATALATMREHAPSLVILDLNSPRTDPLGTVAEMK